MPTEPPTPRSSGGTALVLSGGGARAAYQVGLLRFLARELETPRLPILTGVSAGAINAACLAAHGGSFREAVEDLTALWSGLEIGRVFRTDAASLLTHVGRWGLRLIAGGAAVAPEVRGLVDTSPLRRLLAEGLAAGPDGKIPGIERALAAGRLSSLAILTTNYGTGQSVIWVDGEQVDDWERPSRRSIAAALTIDHVMASAALPLFFPAVRLGDAWHGDGGVRLATPLSPAIHLGAERILAVSTRYRRTQPEADRPTVAGYPPPLQIGGQLLNAVFLDMLDQDALRVERLNTLLRELPPERRHGLRLVEVTTVRPSRDLGTLAGERERTLPRAFRYLLRGLGSRDMASPDLLSLLLFEGDYCRRLIELGEADAEERGDEILALFG